MGATASPILHYKMNDNAASSVVVDAMGDTNGVYNDRVAGAINTDTGDVAGKINGALNFADDYISIPRLITSGTYSIAMWIKPTESADAQYLYDGRLGTGGLAYAHLSSNATVTVDTGTVYVNNVATTGGINWGEWNHVVVTGLTLEIVEALLIGIRYAYNDTTDFQGPIDDIRVYSGTLSVADVANIYYGGAGTEDENPEYIPTVSNALMFGSNF